VLELILLTLINVPFRA